MTQVQTQTQAQAQAQTTGATATPKEMFEVHIPELLKNKPELVQEINSSFQFNLTGENGGQWYIDLRQPPSRVVPGQLSDPGVTVTISAKDFVSLSFGELNPQLAFMTGRLKVRGDLALALKLQLIIVKTD
jgi:putative sterol carrier protein